MRAAECVLLYLAEVTTTKAPTTQRQDRLYHRTLFTPRRVEIRGREISRAPLDPALPVDLIGPPEVDSLHQDLRATPVLANRVVSFVSQVCDFAERKGARPANTNPTRSIRLFSERPSTTYLPAVDRAAFLEAAWDCARRGEVSPQAACVCVLMLLAGLRLHEATDLSWREVDLEQGLIRLLPREQRPSRTNKSGEDRARPITDDVIAVIASMPRFCAFVCPNPDTREPYVDIRKPMRRICERAGIDPATTRHALRHSFGTALAEVDLTAEQIMPWMGHTTPSSAWRYIHLSAPVLRRHRARIAGAAKGGRS